MRRLNRLHQRHLFEVPTEYDCAKATSSSHDTRSRALHVSDVSLLKNKLYDRTCISILVGFTLVMLVFFVQTYYYYTFTSSQDPKNSNPNLTNDNIRNTVIGMIHINMVVGSKDGDSHNSLDYDERTYERFVGSLRSTGFRGNIILPVTSTTSHRMISYLTSQNVTMKHVSECNTASLRRWSHICLQDYSNVPTHWIPYLFARKFIKECETCQYNAVMLASIPHVHFIRDPFLKGDIVHNDFNQGLHLFETLLDMTNSRVATVLHQCAITTPKFYWSVPMLSARIIMGDAPSIRFFLDNIISVMYQWSRNKDCPYQTNEIVLAIMTYLYYNGDIYARVHSSRSWKRKKSDVVEFLSSPSWNEKLLLQWRDTSETSSSTSSTTSILVSEDLQLDTTGK